MEDLIIKGHKGADTSPDVEFYAETGICKLYGESYMEKTIEFYNKLETWLEDYIVQQKSLEFIVKLKYFNTSSSKCIHNMLVLLKEYEEQGGNVIVKWHYDNEDMDMYEEIEDFIIGSGLNIIAIENKN